MTGTQKKTLLALAAIALVYFILFSFPNNTSAKDEHMMLVFSNDETVTYPYVVHMVTPGKDLRETGWRLLIHGDYHYGYPFYFASFLTVLPVRLLLGMDGFLQNTQLNLLLLRQLISVLPIVLAAGLLVFMQTGYRSLVKSVGLFVFLLTLRALVRNNLHWWHPDAMTVLALVLTLFFLERDRLRFGRYFLLAAFTCALATAIKLVGLFFGPAIALYLIVGVVLRRVRLSRAVLVSALFLAILVGTVVAANPFSWFSGPREDFVRITGDTSRALQNGFTHDDPTQYQKGPYWWEWTLRKWYAHPLFLGFLALSLAAGCLWGPRKFLYRLIAAWIVPYSIYLLWFVAIKPDHYWLGILLPLFSCALSLPESLRGYFESRAEGNTPRALRATRVVTLVVIALLGVQTVINVSDAFSGNVVRYKEALYREIDAGY